MDDATRDLLDRIVREAGRDPSIRRHLARMADLRLASADGSGGTRDGRAAAEALESGAADEEYEMLVGRLAVQLARPGESPAELARWLGDHCRDALDRLAMPAPLSYPRHYEETAPRAPGDQQELSLVRAETDGLSIDLEYRWSADLSAQEADRLDTRARAYVACAIYDAALAGGLESRPGPPHGSRPSWLIPGEAAPISLVYAGFDVARQACFLRIGAVHTVGGRRVPVQCATALVAGFKRRFGSITA